MSEELTRVSQYGNYPSRSVPHLRADWSHATRRLIAGALCVACAGAFLARFSDEPLRYSRFLVPGVADTLRALKEKGLLLGLASSSPHWCIDNFLAECGLAGIFDVVLSGEEVAAPKPAPDVYLAAMEALGVEPSRVLVVEDSPIGLRAAHDSGARVCSILPPSAPALDQSLADVHVDRFGDVLKLV